VPQSLVVAELKHRTGNPHVLTAAFAGAGIAISLAAIVLWLAIVAVRERLALEGRDAGEVPRPGLPRLGVRAVALTTVTSLTFAYLESYLHWREGLGWHGIDCLVGPVHRNAIPVLIAFSILAVALHTAAEHLLAWTRRLVTTLAAQLPWAGYAPASSFGGVVRTPHARPGCSQGSPRGPPRLLLPVLSN
jgi:hypothetical protein